jgi:phytoene dehydrogenase-like protein
VPVKAACLDVGLSKLPRPQISFALGLDRPYYFSVHSKTANLAPAGQSMVHVAKYLALEEQTPAQELERELEGVLDLAQPGWRQVLLERRFLPNLVVVNAVATAAMGGIAGRPGPQVPGMRGLYVAGDWVGSEGWLSDAGLASAKRAAALLLGGAAGVGEPLTVRARAASPVG